MAHLYDDSDEMDNYDGSPTGFADYAGADTLGNAFGQPSYMQPSAGFGGASAFGAVGGGMAAPMGGSMGGGFGMGADPLAGGGGGGIGFGAASKFGGIGDAGNPFGMNNAAGGNFGGGAIATDYVDLSKVKAPEVKTHKPNKFATSSKSSMKKPGKSKDSGRGVSFGDVKTFYVDKESQLTETDKKSKSEDDDTVSFEDEDEIQNKALASKMSDKKEDEDKKEPLSIAAMVKKMNSNFDESITESGSLGLKKSVESDDYKISSSQDMLNKKLKQKSPTGLSDSDEGIQMKSHDLDSKKLSSEYDSAELSRNFNYDESEETLNRSRPKSEKSEKSEKSKKSQDNDTEYDDDFESTSNLYESSMSKPKSSHSKHDEIEDIRKRSEEYKSKLEDYNKSQFKTTHESEDEVSQRLDSDRIHLDKKEESDSERPSDGLLKARLSAEETQYKERLASNKMNIDLNEELTREKYEAEIKAKEHEMEAEVSKREAMNATETNKLLKERLQGYIQDINMYRVEIEGLKRQVDVADSNAQSKEEELNQVKTEYEAQLKMERERQAAGNVRMENREINDLKKECRLLKAAHDQAINDKFEEVDYLTKRCDKLETENVSLRVGSKAIRDAENKAKKLEDEMHSLRMRLKEKRQEKEAKPVLGVTYNHWTKEQLVKELNNIDNAIDRFTKENEALMHENKKQKGEIEELNHLLRSESKKLEDYKHRVIKETGSVLIVEEDKDLHAKVMNDLGVDHAITQKEFNEIKQRLFKAEEENSKQKQDFTIREIEYKKEIERIREQRVESEKKLIGLDSALKTQLETNEKMKEDHHESLTQVKEERDEMKIKLDWYTENQDIMGEERALLNQKEDRIDQLKDEVRQLKANTGDRKVVNKLERQVRDLQDALKKKNPDSISLMLESVKPTVDEQEQYIALKNENEKLKRTLQDKDNEFDQKLRNYRNEMDKMKIKYEKVSAAKLPEDVKGQRIIDLERQVQETKDFYIERIKKIQESSGKMAQIKNEMKSLKEIETLKKDLDNMNKDKKKLEKELSKANRTTSGASPNMVLAINALLEQDYTLTLCALYSQTTGIKKKLEKSRTFDGIIKDVEGLIDQFDQASQKYKTSKATVLLSKIIDKCMELSKLVSNTKGRVDKSRPHSKLTSIEHLLKEEIESNIGQNLDANSDLQVVDYAETTRSRPPKSLVPTTENDDYWSDFSDDDYSTEINEEKNAKEILSSIQRWAYNSNIERNLESKYSPSSVITLEQFRQALSDEGYHSEYIELQALLKRLDISHDTGVDYKQFFENLNNKNAAWWDKRLKSNGLEVAAQGKADGNYRPLCNQAVYEFINTNIGIQTKQAINKAGYLSVGELLEEIYYDNPSGLTKKQLRKELLEKQIPLTRLDTHILYKTLENPDSHLVVSSEFKRFVDDPQEFVVAKGLDKVGAASQQLWIDEAVDEVPAELGGKASQYDEPLNRLRQHIKDNRVDIKAVIKKVDTSAMGEINRTEFIKFNKSIKSPLTVLEQKGLFNHLSQSTGKIIYTNDLINILISAPKSAPAPAPRPSPSPAPSPAVVQNTAELDRLQTSIAEKNQLIISLQSEINHLKTLQTVAPPSAEVTQKIRDLESQNREFKEEAKKAQREKKGLEKILKENITAPDAGDFLLLQKKLESMEHSMIDRERQNRKEFYSSAPYQKYKKDVENLTKQLEGERQHFQAQLNDKNQQISMFRSELDILLQEIDQAKQNSMENERMFMTNKGDLIPR